MLDGLDEVPWAKLQHAYGSAEDVPELIRALASDSEETRREAIDELFGNIWHQGTVYPATAHAVPFLAELATSPGPQDRAMILVLLGEIAGGAGYLEVHEPLFAEDGVDLGATEEDRKAESAAVSAARDAVSRELARIQPLLRDADPTIRAAAATIMARAPATRALVREARAQEDDERVQRVLDLTLFLQGDGDALDESALIRAVAGTWEADDVREALTEFEQGRRQFLETMLTDLIPV